jgi:hypothetical protein
MCGKSCDLTNAYETCSTGTCDLRACEAGWGDCDGNFSNGCETELDTVDNCEMCGLACSIDHATETCTDNTCQIDGCEAGWDDCDGDPSNGIELKSDRGGIDMPAPVTIWGDCADLQSGSELNVPSVYQSDAYPDQEHLVELSDLNQGAQQQAKLTGITVQFQTLSAPNPGLYNFTVDMEGQETTGTQNQQFNTLSETGVAEVEVVDADPAGTDDLEILDLSSATSAPQNETALEVTAIVNNTNSSPLEGSAVYCLEEDADPAFDGTDLLTQQQNVTVAGNGQTNVTFFVDLTEEDEAINTSDDIRHGVAAVDSESNLTAQLNITDGPIFHSNDDGATINRTTGLIQTAEDISTDATEDVVVVSMASAPYGENVTVDIEIVNDTDVDSPDSTTEQIYVEWDNSTTVEVVNDSEVENDSDYTVTEEAGASFLGI